MMGLGLPELIVILVIIVILFGSRKLPDLARGIGQSIRGFKEEINAGEPDDKSKSKDRNG